MDSDRETDYILGNSDHEHERLIRQAARLAPVTGRFFLEAGIGPGQRVLDLGSGVGDVAILVSKIVGPSGQVVAVEKDARTIKRAQTRATEAGLDNITFVNIDIVDFSSTSLFDAAVGRYILQFLPNPVEALRSIARTVRSGGIIAFQEGSWKPFLALSGHLPLRYAAVTLLYESSVRGGVDTEMGPALHRVFQAAGLPAPMMRLQMELGCEPDYTRWLSDSIKSKLPVIKKQNLSLKEIGDVETLQERLQKEVVDSNTVVPWIALVGAWCRTP